MSSNRPTLNAQVKAIPLSELEYLRAQNAEQLYFFAIRLYESKQYDKALRLLEYLLRTEGRQYKFLRIIAIVLQADEQFEKAITFYSEALASDEQHDPLMTLGLAQSLVSLKRFNDAWFYLLQTQERLKHSSVSPRVRNQLVPIFVPLMERVQELKTSVT